MDSSQSGKQPSATKDSDQQHPSGNNFFDAASSQQHRKRIERKSNNVAVAVHHHDSFGEVDSGVDYGPPIDLEEEVPHDAVPTEFKSQQNDAMEHFNNSAQSINQQEEIMMDATTTTVITLEELEETVGLREATLESLHDKLSKLNDEIQLEQKSSSLLQKEIELLKKKKIVWKKRTENNVHLVKELEGTLERCLERLRRVMDADDGIDDVDNDDADAKEEVKIDDLPHLSVAEDHDLMMKTESANTTRSSKDDFDVIQMPITVIEQDKCNIAWPSLDGAHVKRVRKEAASLPFAFPVWRTSELSRSLYTNLDSPKLLLDMMNMTVLEHLLCREVDKVDNNGGCGQVNESKVWGTSLDIMTHVKWEHLLPSLRREMMVEEAHTDSGERRLDPNVQLCPYELGGTCADKRCPYQHLSRSEPTEEEVEDAAQDDIIKYHSLSKLVLPTIVNSCSGGASEVESTNAPDGGRISEGKATNANIGVDLKQAPAKEESDEELNPSAERTNQREFEENDDYVSLPIVTETTGEEPVSGNNSNDSRDLVFSERFWWYNEQPFDTSWNGNGEPRDVFDQVVASFGFRRNGGCLEHIAQPSSVDNESFMNELIVDARLIDLCRVCMHMGQGSFALAVLETFQKSVPGNRFHKTLQHARREVKASIFCNSSQNAFDTQLSLLLLSTYICAQFHTPDLNINELGRAMNLVSGKKDAKYEELLTSVVSRSPKRLKVSSAQSENKWTALERSLNLMLEKEVIVPFSQLAKGGEYSYFLNCVTIGKVLENAVYEMSQEHTFSPLLHALEPTWATLQMLLHTSHALSTKRDWLEPDLIVTVIIVPVIYACVSKTIAVTIPSRKNGNDSTTHDVEKCHPKQDMRTIANLTCLDKCIVGILKTLNKSRQEIGIREMTELLVTPLHAISVGISMTVRAVDKAQMKLCYALSIGRIHRGVPSIYAMSSMLWSQLIQLHFTLPTYTSALRYEHMKLSLANDVISSHQDIVSRLFEHGVILHSVVLPGDCQITTSSLSTKWSKKKYKAVWEEVLGKIYSQHSGQDQNETVADLDLVLSNQEYSCFPEILLLAGGSVKRLRMTNCGLKNLPMSFGFCLSNLQV